jgi:glutaredoxin
MENQNVNQGNTQSDFSNLKKMFSDYQKKASARQRRTSAEILAKYFVPRKTKETFRILPPKGRKHIEEAFFHVVPTLTAGAKKKHGTVIYCPAHNDPKVPKLDQNAKPVLDGNGQPMMIPAPCPLCIKAKKILAQQDPSLKGVKKDDMNEMQKKVFEKNKEIFTEASKWEAKKFYIVRGIDKGAEKDGVKFWRFKHNFKNQGTLDKLLPILELFMTENQADFSSAENGTDLNIIMTDTEFQGHSYKQISAITAKGKSSLHADPIVARQWLDDDITWRDVFLPKKAPGIDAYQFLEMVVSGTNPYWDDIDQNNKHWVFPGRPDLEAAANTRTRNLDADNDEAFEQASDLDEEYPRVTVSNITEANVGTFSDTAVDVGAAVLASEAEETTDEDQSSPDNFDDLPF